MTHYFADFAELLAAEKHTRREGILHLHTVIDVRGNPKKGPVPVNVTFVASFTPAEKYQEIDPENGDVYWESYVKDFEDKAERDSYLENFFVIAAK